MASGNRLQRSLAEVGAAEKFLDEGPSKMRYFSPRDKTVQDFIKLIHSAIGSESTWRFVLVVGLGFGIVSSIGAGGLAWLVDKGYKKTQSEKQLAESQAEMAEGPYIILDYLRDSKGNSGFYVRNDGRQTALQVQINEIRGGTKVATFGELSSVRNDGQNMGTYSTSTPLEEVLAELPDKTVIPVVIDYYGFDGERHFQSECTFEYWRGKGLNFKKCRKKPLGA